MLDRQVRQTHPKPGDEGTTTPFSGHLAARNLILLGDPGAGKTELFRQAARASGGEYLTARRVLTTPIERLPRDRPLWIDALDESRSGRGDSNTVDSVIKQLEALQPQAVRLSCRVADWLGKSDLAAFSSYFENNGGAPVVVHLQALSSYEQRHILQQHGIEGRDSFLAEARHRGLDTLLANPQTLLMLAQVVRGQQWPTTRSELFLRAATVLLEEHNDVHSERDSGPGQHTARELLPAAGALCAVRLISDCDGFSLRTSNREPNTPGYRDIPLEQEALMRSALTRRIFVSTGIPDAVDYVHRTIAEYLGARWIAEKISLGLPLLRVQALLGIDGQPASAMRGLHAWLAVLAPSATSTLMDADPMGIVMYADPAQLNADNKKQLMTALARHADRDPWFYHGGHAAHGIGALSEEQMADTFRDILLSPSTPTSLRVLVVDTQTEGKPLPELRDDMLSLMRNASAPFAVRDGCIEALCAMDEAGRSAVCAAYPELGDDENGIRLRCKAMRALFGHGLDSESFVQLVRSTVESRVELPIGTTWNLEGAIPATEAPELLDRLDFTPHIPEQGYPHRQTRALVRIYEGLLVKALLLPALPEAERLSCWLRALHRYASRYGLEGSLKHTLDEHADLAPMLFDSWLACFEPDEPSLYGWYSFRRTFAECFDDTLVLDRLHNALGKHAIDKEAFIYCQMLQICFWHPYRYADLFDLLYEYANNNDALVSFRDEYCLCKIESWRAKEHHRELNRKAKHAENRAIALSQFDSDQGQIVAGNHFGWMAEIADHYFAHYDIDDRSDDPMTRLRDFLGESRTAIALSGLKALIESRHIVPLSELISLNLEGTMYRWWYAVIAGLDLMSAHEVVSANFSDEYLGSAIALACLHPVYRHVGNTMESWDHTWLRQIIELRPELACTTYAAILAAGLRTGRRYLDGLQELQSPALAGPHRSSVIEDLLTRFPQMHSDSLETLLRMAKDDGLWPRLAAATAAGVTPLSEGEEHSNDRRDTRHLWLAFGFLTEPDRYQSQIESLDRDEADALVWWLLEIGSIDRHRHHDFGQFSIDQLMFVAQYAAKRYPFAKHPTGVMHGSRNPWDASDAIGRILATLSASTDDAAHNALLKLAADPALESYATQTKHLLAEQHVRRIDAAHRPPDWHAATAALANHAPASAEDLHALMIAQLHDLCRHIANANTDPYKQFWNTDTYGKIVQPKTEEVARDALVELLRPRLRQAKLRAEPEGHMALDKRADIVVFDARYKCVIELKRDYHAEVWSAAADQLDRLYARDPEASGYGIYGVFWYGDRRGASIPAPPPGYQRPRTSSDLLRILEETLPQHLHHKIKIVVLDVSGQNNVD